MWLKLVNHVQVLPPDVAKLVRLAKVFGIGVNVAILGWTVAFTGRNLYRALRLRQEKAKQTSSFVERIWTVVAQVGALSVLVLKQDLQRLLCEQALVLLDV